MSTIQSSFVDVVHTITDDVGHSQSLALDEGDYTLEIPDSDGHEVTTGETRGHLTGLRGDGKRAFGKLTVTAKLADPGAAFQTLAGGRTAGFVSTTADLGNAACVDWVLNFPYAAALRSYYGEDAHYGPVSIKVGDICTISFSADLYGPIRSNDSTNGIVILVSAR